LPWAIEFAETAVRQLKKLDKTEWQRIREFLTDRVAKLENPRSLGKALHGPKLGEFWKYRVGDYRLICSIEDARFVVLVLRIGNRREVYR
jgi:mRNA interferase RelE/StbE